MEKVKEVDIDSTQLDMKGIVVTLRRKVKKFTRNLEHSTIVNLKHSTFRLSLLIFL